MKDAEKKHPLIEVWERYPATRKEKKEILKTPPIERIIGEMFAIGEFYYYVLNLTNSTLSHHHENILKLHGLKKNPENLKEVIDLTHPEDIPFVIKAEQAVVSKMIEIGPEHHLYLKSSYCFRMKTAKGNYELFHHQAIPTLEDENGNLVQSINIHTNINHITKQNPYTVLISGIGPRADFHQMTIDNPSSSTHQTLENLTKREVEILSLIAKGYSGTEISEMLILSQHTVRSHRKNILTKTNSRNGKELLKKAFEWGII
ncbi:response regulator transcription factor [Chryseobacterium sp. PTM-20240506]|uniref:response regulator transcription factor n=2 Tax=Chryseobacterium TaxID=59732 RepID=UPI00155427C1|nr:MULTISPECIES: LuxR C-terminal-related transcriptional regulator [unclassified Chryseobacterium]MDC8105352.1 LuxR C-terminal-related transcriptional regulator [Chryseobacterium sp. B21-037]MDQ1805606.1 LuxR C-terminal-related transcriptional regulator [Chryseobacterium sp. CKR4-1]WBV58762.1 LuxR C-terminal-related transcriptional regulator [Chryseobacterium daecheongense]